MEIRSNQNLVHCYAREINYWETIWNQKDSGITKRLDENQLCHCPHFIIKIVADLTRSLNRKPRVMDFGCGPFSNINYLHNKGLAEIIGVDVLSDDYAKFYEKYGIIPPIPMISCSGESLSEEAVGGQFDFTFVQNALDHTASPILTWLNLYKLTKVGGYIGHCHASREATYQDKDQLHQYDLYADGVDLIIDDLDGQVCSLIQGLNLDIVSHEHIKVEPDKTTGQERPAWFYQIYRKTGEAVSAEFLSFALDNLKKSFVKRSEWAMNLERICLNSC
jgi:hypothetical protein